jgi:hypothetical protein
MNPTYPRPDPALLAKPRPAISVVGHNESPWGLAHFAQSAEQNVPVPLAHPPSNIEHRPPPSKLLDSTVYAADTSCIDLTVRARLSSLHDAQRVTQVFLGGNHETHACRARAGGALVRRLPSDRSARLRLWRHLLWRSRLWRRMLPGLRLSRFLWWAVW